VGPRGSGPLILFSLLAVMSLAIGGAAGTRLVTTRRARS
jgi:hypothetical protein